jgi:hypothetical protein
MSIQFPAAEMITVPGRNHFSFGYFCFIESDLPGVYSQFDCKIRTAFYRCVQTSVFAFILQAIQLKVILPYHFDGAQTIFDNFCNRSSFLHRVNQCRNGECPY